MTRAWYQALAIRDYESQGNIVHFQCLFGLTQVNTCQWFNLQWNFPEIKANQPTPLEIITTLHSYSLTPKLNRRKRNLLNVCKMILAFKNLSEVKHYMYFPVYFFLPCKQRAWKPGSHSYWPDQSYRPKTKQTDIEISCPQAYTGLYHWSRLPFVGY